MEALENGSIKLTDMVPVSEDAASKGRSQIYLEVSEEMTVGDMIKAVVISSANDAQSRLRSLSPAWNKLQSREQTYARAA